MMSLSSYKTMDPFILLSAVNMQLRDEYASLEELCRVNEIDETDLKKRLGEQGFAYVREINQFR